METVSEEFKKRFAKAERAGIPSTETRQIINILEAIGVPVGISVSSSLANFFVEQAQKRGITVPTTQLTKVEARAFQSKVMKVCPDFDVKIDPEVRQQLLSKAGIVVKPAPVKTDDRYKYYTDDMLHQMNLLHKDILLSEELKEHPLLAIAMKREARPQLPTRRKR